MEYSIKNIKELCSGLSDEKLKELYRFLEKSGVMAEFKQYIADGNEDADLVESMSDTLADLVEDNYWIHAYIDYYADTHEIPWWMGKDRIAEAIINDIKESNEQ